MFFALGIVTCSSCKRIANSRLTDTIYVFLCVVLMQHSWSTIDGEPTAFDYSLLDTNSVHVPKVSIVAYKRSISIIVHDTTYSYNLWRINSISLNV